VWGSGLFLFAVGAGALVSSGAASLAANDSAPRSATLLFVAGKSAELRVVDLRGRGGVLPAGRGPHATPAWSPDGRRIAFSARGEIAVVSAGGGRPRRLTHSAALDFQPVWSPDGRRLAFFSQGAQDSVTLVRDDVMVMNDDGTGARKLVTAPVQHPFLSWSHDGGWLLFARRGFGASQLVLVDTRTAERKLLMLTGSGRDPVFSPDGSLIAFVRGTTSKYQLAVRQPHDTAPRVLYETAAPLGEPAWSPDGRRLVVVVVSDTGMRSHLEVIGVGGRSRRILTKASRNVDTSPAWSPDGQRVVFVRHTPRMAPAEGVLATIRPSGAGLRLLPHTHLTDRFAAAPQWKP
jgi:Tol biopolymer transport system component